MVIWFVLPPLITCVAVRYGYITTVDWLSSQKKMGRVEGLVLFGVRSV